MFLVGKNMLIKKKRFIFSSKGSLTVQFLLGFVLILSFMVIFGAMTLTLAVASITQYITYASSRSLFLGFGNEALQKQNAQEKFDLLKSQLVRSDGLIDISQKDIGLNRAFSPGGGKPNLFYGVWTEFLPKILKVETLWGNTTDENVDIFKTVVGSYLGREPSGEECDAFNKRRWEFIKRIHGDIGYAQAPLPYTSGFDCDNGC